MEQVHSFLVAELGSERTDWLPGSKPLIVLLLKYKDLLCAGAELSLVWQMVQETGGYRAACGMRAGQRGAWNGQGAPRRASWKRQPAS